MNGLSEKIETCDKDAVYKICAKFQLVNYKC